MTREVTSSKVFMVDNTLITLEISDTKSSWAFRLRSGDVVGDWGGYERIVELKYKGKTYGAFTDYYGSGTLGCESLTPFLVTSSRAC